MVTTRRTYDTRETTWLRTKQSRPTGYVNSVLVLLLYMDGDAEVCPAQEGRRGDTCVTTACALCMVFKIVEREQPCELS